MRAMPSPISSTRPTVWVSSWGRYCSISDCRTEMISSALNLMAAFLDQLVACGDERTADRAVKKGVADAQHDAAQQVGNHFFVQDWLQPQRLADVFHEAAALVVVQRHGSAHLHGNPPRARMVKVNVSVSDEAQQIHPLVVIQHHQKVEEEFAHPTGKSLLQNLRLGLAAHNGASQ